MNSLHKFRAALSHLLVARREELGRWRRYGRYALLLGYHCVRRLRANNALATSAALSFASIFALVPAIVLGFLVIRSIGVLGDTGVHVHRLLERAGFAQIAVIEVETAEPEPWSEGPDWAPTGALGAAAPLELVHRRRITLAQKLEEVIHRVEQRLTIGQVGPVGVLLLIWSTMMLMTTIERGLNRIFGAPQTRPLGRRIMLYWTILTLGPVLLVSVGYAGSHVARTTAGLPVLGWLASAMGWLGSVLVGISLLMLVYKLVPNTSVNARSALLAAMVAVSLWLLAKWAFGLYVARVAGLNLYGALGLLPLFLVWVNLSWYVFLFGAELAHTAASLNELRQAAVDRPAVATPSDLLAVAMVVARAFHRGHGPIARQEIAQQLGLSDRAVEMLLERLRARGIVYRLGIEQEQGYVLARPADQLPVTEVIEIGRPEGEEAALGIAPYEPDIAQAVAQVSRRAREAMEGLTLAEVLPR